MISKDEHYDFDYQETRHLSDPVVMKPVSVSKINVMTVYCKNCESIKQLLFMLSRVLKAGGTVHRIVT